MGKLREHWAKSELGWEFTFKSPGSAGMGQDIDDAWRPNGGMLWSQSSQYAQRESLV